MGVAVAGRGAENKFAAVVAIAIHSHYLASNTGEDKPQMYVCICNAIRDRDLRDAARSCDGDVDSVYQTLGRTPQCRQCLEDAADIISEERLFARLSGDVSHCLPISAEDGALPETLVGA
jgi:bacterioferritin-associated ferredoxin